MNIRASSLTQPFSFPAAPSAPVAEIDARGLFRRHTATGVVAADAADAGLCEPRWVTIDNRRVPLAAQLQAGASALPPAPPEPSLRASQLADALHAQAPDLLPQYTLRFARDVGYELCALHHGDKRAYLSLTLEHVRFFPPATFCLSPSADEQPFAGLHPRTPLPQGTLGYAPDDQRGGVAHRSEASLMAIDCFSWAASLCKFAAGEPLVPVWSAQKAPAPWVLRTLAELDVDVEQIRNDDEREFFSQWALDHVCSLISDAHATPAPGAHVEDVLARLGGPWPQLPRTLGPLFPRLVECFDLHWRSRPHLEGLLPLL